MAKAARHAPRSRELVPDDASVRSASLAFGPDADRRSFDEEILKVAVKIRLMRVGKKKQPTYRVVVADSRSPRDGRFIEIHRPVRAAPGAVGRRHRRRPALALAAQGRPADRAGAEAADVSGVWAQYESEKGEAAGRHEAGSASPHVTKAAAPTAAEAQAAEAAAAEPPEAPAATADRAGRRSRRSARRRRRRVRRERARPNERRTTRRRARRRDDEYDDEIAGEGNRGRRSRQGRGRARRAPPRRRSRRCRRRRRRRRDDVTLLVHASPGDMGRLIGKRGRVIQALRQVGRAAGSTEGVRPTSTSRSSRALAR